MRGKYDADVARLQEVIQHGVDVAGSEATWGVAFDQLIGRLPRGVDASRFSSRKRFAMAHLMLKLIQSGAMVILGGLIAFGFIWVGVIRLSENGLYLTLGMGFLVLIYLAGWQPFFRNLALYRGVKILVQATPDVEHELMFVPEQEVARQFGQARLKSRVFGVLLMVMAVGFCYVGYVGSSDEIPVLVFAMPFFFFMGLALLISGINKPEMVYRRGYAQARWADLPLEMKLCLVMGVMASVLGSLWVQGWGVF